MWGVVTPWFDLLSCPMPVMVGVSRQTTACKCSSFRGRIIGVTFSICEINWRWLWYCHASNYQNVCRKNKQANKTQLLIPRYLNLLGRQYRGGKAKGFHNDDRMTMELFVSFVRQWFQANVFNLKLRNIMWWVMQCLRHNLNAVSNQSSEIEESLEYEPTSVCETLVLA